MTAVQAQLPNVTPKSIDKKQRESLFELFFVEGDETVIKLKKQAIGCELQNSSLRIISWKMFLGLLSTPPRIDEWLKEIGAQREHFTLLKEKYANMSMDEEIDPNINNPLSLDSNSPWSVYFENEQLRKTIVQDVDRIYPEYTYFQSQWVKDMMTEILFVYSKEYPDVSYKQGMHELLAPVIYILDKEKMDPTEGSSLSKLMDSNFIEHDAYIIFERLMRTTGSWFISKSVKDKQPDKDSPILQKCQFIYHKLLKSRDPSLYSYLISLKIEPQLFLLRWLRLLFGREFPFDETLCLWDAIFSYDKNFSLIDHIAVSMLPAIREQILLADQNGVLQLLFKYPGSHSISSFVDDAVSMAKSKSKSKPKTNPPVQSAQPQARTTNTNPPTPSGNTSNRSSFQFPKLAVNPLSLYNSTPVPTSPGPNPTESELQQLKTLHKNIADRLDDIVNVLQINLLPAGSTLPNSDSLFLSLAELKQIKDVMKGHLPVDALPGPH